eukprot:2588116-Pyramimonas_sp.AAC.2
MPSPLAQLVLFKGIRPLLLHDWISSKVYALSSHPIGSLRVVPRVRWQQLRPGGVEADLRPTRADRGRPQHRLPGGVQGCHRKHAAAHARHGQSPSFTRTVVTSFPSTSTNRSTDRLTV